jgi:predicted AAA+ superfamily ATPase
VCRDFECQSHHEFANVVFVSLINQLVNQSAKCHKEVRKHPPKKSANIPLKSPQTSPWESANIPLLSSKMPVLPLTKPLPNMDNSRVSYRKRIIDDQVASMLASAGGVLIEGPKGCGKTETARQQAGSEVLLDTNVAARQAAESRPEVLLEGETPRLIDEWQLVPGVWDLVRRAADERGTTAQFILTGSAVPPDDETRHVGAMRIIRVQMRPMSLFESGHSSGAVSLADLLKGNSIHAPESALTIPEIADLATVGGWPVNLSRTVTQAQNLVRGFINEIARADLRRVDGVKRDPQLIKRLLRSLARNVGTPAKIESIRADVNGADGATKHETISDYMNALSRLMVTEDLTAWAPALRSRTRLRALPIRHFVDPSLAVAEDHRSAATLLTQMQWFGFVFENLVIRDLRVYAQALDATVYHYRDESGLEVDAIIEMPSGQWAAFEVKLGLTSINSAAENLLKLAKRVDQKDTGAPLALAVITGTGYAHIRRDGVAVIPIGSLGP